MATQKSASKRNLTPREPGETLDESQLPEQAAEGNEPETPEVAEPEGLTDDLKAYIDAQVAAQTKANLKAARREDMLAKRNAKRRDEADLPTQEEAKKLAEKSKRAVLSKDGYVVPINPEDVRRAGNAPLLR